MATSDGELCSVEDRALAAWENQPWGDGPDPQEALELARTRWFDRASDAFRAGFRAGQEAGYLQGVREAEEKRATLLERQGAAADPQLGVELARIRDRLNSLEKDKDVHTSHINVHTSCINGQAERIEKLERTSVSRLGHVADLERIDKRFANVDQRLSAIEAKLRKLEPIG